MAVVVAVVVAVRFPPCPSEEVEEELAAVVVVTVAVAVVRAVRLPPRPFEEAEEELAAVLEVVAVVPLAVVVAVVAAVRFSLRDCRDPARAGFCTEGK